MNTYQRMLLVAAPYLKPLLDPPDVWHAEIQHDDGCNPLSCACKPEIYFTRHGETQPLIRLSLVGDELAIDLNEKVRQ